MSADVTAGEDAAGCCALARACLDTVDQKPGEAERWLREAVNWAARGLVRAQRGSLGTLDRAEREEEATAVLLQAAVRLAHERARSAGRCCCPAVEELHQEVSDLFAGADGWSGGDVVALLTEWFTARALPVPD